MNTKGIQVDDVFEAIGIDQTITVLRIYIIPRKGVFMWVLIVRNGFPGEFEMSIQKESVHLLNPELYTRKRKKEMFVSLSDQYLHSKQLNQ